jgi:dTDP-4-dehydrorhamnose reductase
MRGSNFLLTMLRLAEERDALEVVSDQVGAPTWSRTLADSTALILAQARGAGAQWWQRNGGVYHLSSQGQTSWYGFTEAILAAAGLACKVTPIASDAWPAAAPRPRNSVLDTSKLRERFCTIPEWQDALRLCLG